MKGESDEGSPEYDDLALIVEVDPGPVFRVVAAGGRPVVRGTLAGLPRQGAPLEDVIPEPSARSLLHLETAWADAEPQTYVVERDGDLYDVTVTPVFDADGACSQLFAHSVARRERARDLFNAAILDAIPDAVALVDPTGTVRSVNLGWVRELVDLALPEPGGTYDHDLVRAVLDGTSDGSTAGRSFGDRWVEERIEPIVIDGERWALVLFDDVTELRDALGLWRTSFTAAAVPMAWVDGQLEVREANPALAVLFGRPLEDVVGQRIGDFLDDAASARAEKRRADALAGRPIDAPGEATVIRPDGSTRRVIVHMALVSPGNHRGAVVQLIDVTSQHAAEARLALHSELLELVASGTPVIDVALAVAANIGRAVAGATGAVVLRGCEPVCAPDLDPAWVPIVTSVLHPSTGPTSAAACCVWSAPIRSAAVESPGAVVIMRPGSARPAADDEEAAALLASVLRLAIQRDETASAVATAALHDQSSGLPTSVLFAERLGRAIDRLVARRGVLAILAIGVEGYDEMSASEGWRSAERELAGVAGCVAEVLPTAHELARRGNHLVAMVELPGDDELMPLVQRLRERAGESVSIGASTVTSALITPESALQRAEGALRTARRSPSGWALFDPAVDADQRLAASDLRAALDADRITVHYQPIVDLSDGRVVGLEALVRWEDPDRGFVPPPRLIEIAESGGLLDDVTRLVLATACRDLAAWRERSPDLTMAVNLSGSQLGDGGLVQLVTSALEAAGVPPSALVVEITESVVVEDVDQAVHALGALREIGVRVAIDDFGTGYSSLLYLKRFPADVLKVDRAFVQGLGVSDGDTAIVDAVVGLGHRLGLEVVAEGVETAGQLEELRRRRCDQAQGYLLLRPGPAGALDELIDAGRVAIGPQPAPAAALPSDELDLDELLSVVTHELSTPLTVLSGHAELLAGSLPDDSSVAQAIERNVRNIDELLRSLSGLTTAITSAGQKTTVDIGRLVVQTVEDLAPLHTQHAVTVQAEEGTCVDLDAVATRQILTNLLGNAVKFTPPGTVIDVGVSVHGNRCVLRVADHGPGVPVDREHELFGRFSRLGATVRGLGLGLHLSRELARRQGGDLVHERTPGGGATFVVTFGMPS